MESAETPPLEKIGGRVDITLPLEEQRPLAEGEKPFAFLGGKDPGQIAWVLHKEHPQTAALVLSNLDDPDQAAQILSALPPIMQPDVASRIATMNPTPVDALREVANQFRRRVEGLPAVYETSGGMAKFVEILRRLDPLLQQSIVEGIDDQSPELAGDIQREMSRFPFEDVAKLSHADLARLVQEIPRPQLFLALRDLREGNPVREKLLKEVPEDLRRVLVEEIDRPGETPLADIDEAKNQVGATVTRLAQQGDLVSEAVRHLQTLEKPSGEVPLPPEPEEVAPPLPPPPFPTEAALPEEPSLGEKAFNDIADLGVTIFSFTSVDTIMEELVAKGWQYNLTNRELVQSAFDFARAAVARYSYLIPERLESGRLSLLDIQRLAVGLSEALNGRRTSFVSDRLYGRRLGEVLQSLGYMFKTGISASGAITYNFFYNYKGQKQTQPPQEAQPAASPAEPAPSRAAPLVPEHKPAGGVQLVFRNLPRVAIALNFKRELEALAGVREIGITAFEKGELTLRLDYDEARAAPINEAISKILEKRRREGTDIEAEAVKPESKEQL